MKFALLGLLAMMAVGPFNEALRHARTGNAHYEAGRFELAVAAYRDALASAGPHHQSAILNNLASALYRAGDHPAALEAFDAAVGAALSAEDRSRAFFNGGNAALSAGDAATAADRYRDALRADADNHAARFNLEFVLRQQEGEPPPDGADPDGEPPPGDADGEQPDAPQDGTSQRPDRISPEEAARLLQALERSQRSDPAVSVPHGSAARQSPDW
jgi:tetratricopeptide (TPR) repeat protein